MARHQCSETDGRSQGGKESSQPHFANRYFYCINFFQSVSELFDVLGDDVNIAARIEPFSAPGGIAISNKVNDAIIREEEYETKYIGKPKLKGVGQKASRLNIALYT